jgi:hypothetical protein
MAREDIIQVGLLRIVTGLSLLLDYQMGISQCLANLTHVGKWG